jgi:hypothetical protein
MEGEKQGLESSWIRTSTFPFFTRPENAIFRVWTHAVHGDYELIVSPFIVGEFARVSRRDFHWDEKKVLLHV